jgi:hypothetical protein
MLNGRMRLALGVGLAAVLLAAAVWYLLPGVVALLPGRVRQYVPVELAAATVPPLPTPVPVPQATLAAAGLLPPTPVVTPPGDEATAAPMDVATAVATDVATVEVLVPTANPPSATLAPTATPDYPTAVYLEGVPIVPQKFNNCGPTNLSMVLAYHGLDANQLAIAAVIRPTYEDRNVSPEELAAYVRQETGLAAKVVVGGDLSLLKRLLAAGLPVIVEQGLVPEGDIGWMGHYLTLFGYDDADGIFYARDSFLGPWEEDGREPYDTVLADWRPFNNVLIAVYPPSQEAEVAMIVGPRWDDPVLMWQTAAEVARETVQAETADAFAWFNLGTALTRLYQINGDEGQLPQAVAAFDQARSVGLPPRMLWYQFAPYEAYLAAGRADEVVALAEATLGSQGGRSVEETYIFRALARRVLGDEAGATSDLRRAEGLHPANPILQAVLMTQP